MGGYTSKQKEERKTVNLTANLQEDYAPLQTSVQIDYEKMLEDHVDLETTMIQNLEEIKAKASPIDYAGANFYQERIKTTSKSEKKRLKNLQNSLDSARKTELNEILSRTQKEKNSKGQKSDEYYDTFFEKEFLSREYQGNAKKEQRDLDAKEERIKNSKKIGSKALNYVYDPDNPDATCLDTDVQKLYNNIRTDLVLENQKPSEEAIELGDHTFFYEYVKDTQSKVSPIITYIKTLDEIDEAAKESASLEKNKAQKKSEEIQEKFKECERLLPYYEDFRKQVQGFPSPDELRKTTPEERARTLTQIKKRCDDIGNIQLALKNDQSNALDVAIHERNIRALRIAYDQVEEEQKQDLLEPSYAQAMKTRLMAKIANEMEVLSGKKTGFETFYGYKGKGFAQEDAYIAVMGQLRGLRKEMKEHPEKREELVEEARHIFYNFTYEDTYLNDPTGLRRAWDRHSRAGAAIPDKLSFKMDQLRKESEKTGVSMDKLIERENDKVMASKTG